ncbi:MAG: recombination protein RecR [Verrucomicrobia bacterium RIFCSPHIGHO2_12_FULL_41_10]|nr:MAG: recombination protein RecR [Verrucomicrobia bacterium RIFCSPHIGHO2_12_FULL_41_10]
MHKLPKELLTLASLLRKLPGVGTRTSERFAFDLLGWSKKTLQEFANLLSQVQDKLPPCPECSCLTEQGVCPFCKDEKRDRHQLCLVSSQKDPFSIEATRSYYGLYHVIEHLLSPLDGRHTDALRLDRIEKRLTENGVQELIIAFDSTLEGDTTALYLKERLSRPNLQIFRLAFGLPVGSSLEAIDSGTLTRALSGRQTF